ncbi:LysR family transcriptional regulator [Klebsiella pneumoniae]|nr:LysR family transcriptional regulator [Klebsiella pneumoniae]
MKPLLDVLVILDALEKEGSFAAASAKLFKTPSALSYTIHRLESDLNIQLLDRSGHRARFTPSRTDAAGERAGGAAYRPRTGDPGG